MTRFIIFTNLDGAILHPRTYSHEAALPGLALARARGIPVVFSSSKTRPEIFELRAECSNTDPFIYENGGGIVIPESATEFHGGGVASAKYEVIALGCPYAELRTAFVETRSRLGIDVTGFGDITPDEIAALAGLHPKQAVLACQREFDEPFLFGPGETRAERLVRSLEERGLRWTQGRRFYHLHGFSDKGRAVRILKKLFAADSGPTVSIGLGCSLNDLPMLLAVDRPVLVQREDGSYEERIRLPGLARAPGFGPEAWNRAVESMLSS